MFDWNWNWNLDFYFALHLCAHFLFVASAAVPWDTES